MASRKRRTVPLKPPERHEVNGVLWRECSGCRREFPWTRDYFHSRGKEQPLETRCKDCRNSRERSRRVSGRSQDPHRRRYHKARQRALSRLGEMYPDVYERLYQEEYTEELVRERQAELGMR